MEVADIKMLLGSKYESELEQANLFEQDVRSILACIRAKRSNCRLNADFGSDLLNKMVNASTDYKDVYLDYVCTVAIADSIDAGRLTSDCAYVYKKVKYINDKYNVVAEKYFHKFPLIYM